MRRALLIGGLVTLFIGLYFIAAPYVVLRSAKAGAIKKFADGGWGEKMLNTVPQSAPRTIAPALDYSSTIWMKVTDTSWQVGFPAASFARDPHPKRENAVIHHSHYRAIIDRLASIKEFTPIMEPLGFTNLYEFVSTTFQATIVDIDQQANLDALKRHVILLQAKEVLAPMAFDDSCIEFRRGDLRGFIAGVPSRNKILTIHLYVESIQEFIHIGVIQKSPIQMSDLDALISVLKLQPVAPASSPK